MSYFFHLLAAEGEISMMDGIGALYAFVAMAILIVFAIIRVIVGIISAVVARRRERSVFAWFFLGLIFGVLPCILLAIFERR